MTTRVSTNFGRRIWRLFSRPKKVSNWPIEEAVKAYIDTDNTAKYIRYREQGINLSVAWRFNMNVAFWDRIQQTTCPLSGVGMLAPSEIRHIPEKFKKSEGFIGPLRLKAENDGLIIKAYGKEEWDDYYPKLQNYLAEREAKARGVDGANGEVAQSTPATATGPAA